MSDEVMDEEVDDRLGVETAIAQGLAGLSAAPVAPKEVDVSGEFDADEIAADGTAWLTYLVRVQDWLRLGDRLEQLAPPAAVARRLVGLLADQTATVEYMVVQGDDQVVFTLRGLNLVRERVERAADLQERFLADVDDGSVASATAAWIDAWEEVVDATISGSIVARADVWSINDFASKSRYGRLELSPSYQRGDVWPTKDAQLLMESILRGIPLPSVIVLRPKRDEDTPFEVVDGKQRLTAILRFIGSHPQALKTVKENDKKFPDAHLKDLFETDYPKFRRAWKNATGEGLTATLEKSYFFPFKLATSTAEVGGLAELGGKYYSDIVEKRIKVGMTRLDVRELFESATDYKIPVIEYTEADPRQIHEVFKLYNKQGKHLNAEEIRNAVYHDVALMRAISVTAGDNEDMDAAAPVLLGVRDEVSIIQQNLRDFGVAEQRYRRSKVLSWLMALLFAPPVAPGGKPNLVSTARQINDFLDYVQSGPDAVLQTPAAIQDAVRIVARAMESHASSGCWDEKFRNATGTRWQDLQLMASLLGVAMAGVVLKDGLDARLAEHREELVRRSREDWRRPRKTQTLDQWRFIATTALAILEQLAVSVDDVDDALSRTFESSCVPTLQAAALT